MTHLNEFMLQIGDLVSTPGGDGTIVMFVDSDEARGYAGLVGVQHLDGMTCYYSALHVAHLGDT